MMVKQFYLNCLAHASYMIADDSTKTAVVVDPQRDIDQYLQEAQLHGWVIQYVFLTHFHADFLAGLYGAGGALAAALLVELFTRAWRWRTR